MSNRLFRLALVSGGPWEPGHITHAHHKDLHTSHSVCRYVHVRACGTGARGFMSVIIDVRTGPALDCGAPGSGIQVRTLRVWPL